MSRIYVYCEGTTEEQFVKTILSPNLSSHGVTLIPVMSNLNASHRDKGGVSNYARIRKEIMMLCRSHPNEHVTTMLDYYGFPFQQLEFLQSRMDCDSIEHAIEVDMGVRNLFFHFNLHEFETVLFSDVTAFARYGKDVMADVEKVRIEYPNPEDINTGYYSCPSRRLEMMIQGYRKTGDGILISKSIQLDKMRSECPHFNKWVATLTSIGSQ